MIRVYFKKLVRDKVVDNCLRDDEVLATQWRAVDAGEYRKELIRKVHEEADEIPTDDANPQEMLEEIADLQAVIDTLRGSANVSEADVRAMMLKKQEQKGGFEKRHYIDYVELTDDSAWVSKFREQPHKYAESEGSVPHIDLGVYRHSKSGKLYEVLGVALHTESNEFLVQYRPLYDSEYELFARPYGIFTASVTIDGHMVPRFEKVEGE